MNLTIKKQEFRTVSLLNTEFLVPEQFKYIALCDGGRINAYKQQPVLVNDELICENSEEIHLGTIYNAIVDFELFKISDSGLEEIEITKAQEYTIGKKIYLIDKKYKFVTTDSDGTIKYFENYPTRKVTWISQNNEEFKTAGKLNVSDFSHTSDYNHFIENCFTIKNK